MENRDAAAQHPGGSVTLDTTDFDGNLGAADSTVQAAMETIDGFDIGAGLPVADTTAIVKDPTTATKQMRIDVGAVADETTRVLTMPNQDVDLTPGTGTFQGADPTLTALAGVTSAANKMPYFTGEYTAAVADLPSGYNYIINPCFEINQRGVASVNTNNSLAVDMWKMFLTGSAITSSQQAFTIGQTDVPGEPKYYLRNVVVSSAGNGNRAINYYPVEGVRALAGQTVTLSFYAKADATKPIAVELSQVFGTGGSPSATVTGIGITKITLSTSWAKYTVSIAVPSISGKTLGTGNNDYLSLQFWMDAGSDFNTRTDSLGQQSGTFEFANVKLEAGAVATPFRVPTYAEELEKCQRYLVPLGMKSNVYEPIGESGYAISATTVYMLYRLTPPMRSTPSLISPTSYANFTVSDGVGSVALSANPTLYTYNASIIALTLPVTSGLTQYRPYRLQANNQTTDAMYLSAEL